MLHILHSGIHIPQINHGFCWDITKRVKKEESIITHVDENDIRDLQIEKRQQWTTPGIEIITCSTSEEKTLKGIFQSLIFARHSPVVMLSHIFWLAENRPGVFNSEEKNDRDQFIGNFFFMKRTSFRDRKNQITVGSVMRRNRPSENLEFGLRFYSMDDSRIWKAQDRRIIYGNQNIVT